jgi:hypothetical protein
MMPLGCGKLPDKVDKASVNVFRSMMFMGDPCARNSAGIRFLFIIPVSPFICPYLELSLFLAVYARPGRAPESEPHFPEIYGEANSAVNVIVSAA